MYKNRSEAGYRLGKALEPYKNTFPVVLAIPRGGVEVAHHAIKNFTCDLSVIVSQKLRYPLQEKATFGSIAEDGSLYLDPWTPLRLNRDMINKITNREKQEIQRKVSAYRKGAALPDLTNRTVIIIDDGIASGASVFVTINCCRKRNPRKIVVATPVADKRVESKLTKMSDDLVILEQPHTFYSISQVYQSFEKLSDNDVLQRINTWRQPVTHSPTYSNVQQI